MACHDDSTINIDLVIIIIIIITISAMDAANVINITVCRREKISKQINFYLG